MLRYLARAGLVVTVVSSVGLAATDAPREFLNRLRKSDGVSAMYIADASGVPIHSPRVIARDQCLSVALLKRAGYQCGDLTISYALPSVRVLGKVQAPTLLYNSQLAHPTPSITLDVAIPPGTNIPDTVTYVMKVGGTAVDTTRVLGSAFVGLDPRHRIQLTADAFTYATDVYPVVIESQAKYNGTLLPYRDSIKTEVIVVNRASSPLGIGWWVAGVEEIHIPSTNANYRLWVGGDGSARVYRNASSNVWVADTVDFLDTLIYTGSQYERHLPGGSKVVFNTQGQHINTIDPRGFTTTLAYQSSTLGSPLTTITLPNMTMPYTFGYKRSGGDSALLYVDSPTSPIFGPFTASARRSHMRSYGRVLYQIFKFDTAHATMTPDEYYEIDQGPGRNTGRIILRRERGGRQSNFSYDYNAQLWRTIADRSIAGPDSGARDTTLTCPFFNVWAGPCNNRVPSATEANITVNGPRDDMVEADSALFRLGQFGRPTYVQDAELSVTTIEFLTGGCTYNFPAFPTRVTTGVTRVAGVNGMQTTACPDARGNVATVTAVNPLGNSVNPTTTYTWHQKWDKPTSIVDANSQTTMLAWYNATTSNVDSIGDSRSGSNTLFSYGASGSANKLLVKARKPMTRGALIDFDSITYDSLGNASNFYEVTNNSGSNTFNSATHYVNDAIGRNFEACVDIDNIGASPHRKCTQTFHDGLGRDSVVASFGDSYNGVGSQYQSVTTIFDNEDAPTIVAREATGLSAPLHTYLIHDRAGNVTTEWSDLGDYKFSYHGPGNLLDSVRTRRNQVIKFTYDGMGRLKQKIVPQAIDTARTPSLSLGAREGRAYPNPLMSGVTNYSMPAETFNYSYDVMGRLTLATNAGSRVKRGYYRNGLIAGDTLEILGEGGSWKSYGLNYYYDKLNRRTSLHFPSGLATGGSSDNISYAYDPTTGNLSSVTDPLGKTYAYTYNLRNELTSEVFASDSLRRHLTFDAVGNVLRDSLRGPNAVNLRATRFTYDNREKMLTARDSTGFRDDVAFTYSALGHTLSSKIAQVALDSQTFYYGGSVVDTVSTVTHEVFTTSGLGGLLSSSTADTMKRNGTIQRATPTPATNHYVNQYGRLDSIANTGSDKRQRYTYDRAGNTSFYLQLPEASNVPAHTTTYREDRASSYDAEDRLRAADFRTLPSWFDLRYLFEEYRYDALGRRVVVKTQKVCSSTPDQHLCQIGTLRRTVWDGDRELFEIQTPGFLTTAVADSDNYVANFPLTSGPGEYNTTFGRVLYVHGQSLDQPAGIVRYNYSDRSYPGDTSLYVVPAASMSLLWDLKGKLSQVWCNDGKFRCTGTRVTGHLGEVVAVVPDAHFVLERPRLNDASWHGTLLSDKGDAARTNYRRNRYFDPASGQFTQEDPIGIAGGLNLYGFADGDPVNFSDPFGLCPPQDTSPCSLLQRTVRWLAPDNHTANHVADAVTEAGGKLGTLLEILGFGSGGACGPGVACGVMPSAIGPQSSGQLLSRALASEEALAAAQAGRGISIAGAGARQGKKIDDLARLLSTYGGNADDWAKMSTGRTVQGVTTEVHWYQNVRTGQRVEFKSSWDR